MRLPFLFFLFFLSDNFCDVDIFANVNRNFTDLCPGEFLRTLFILAIRYTLESLIRTDACQVISYCFIVTCGSEWSTLRLRWWVQTLWDLVFGFYDFYYSGGSFNSLIFILFKATLEYVLLLSLWEVLLIWYLRKDVSLADLFKLPLILLDWLFLHPRGVIKGLLHQAISFGEILSRSKRGLQDIEVLLLGYPLWLSKVVTYWVISRPYETPRQCWIKCGRVLDFALEYLTTSVIEATTFLPRYYHLNELLWQDGFLIDFLQKKMVDKWIRKFLVYSAYLLNERLIFDWVIRFYIDSVIWPVYRLMIYEFTSVASTLLATLFLFLVAYLILALICISLIYF